jgi:hypothetical protein
MPEAWARSLWKYKAISRVVIQLAEPDNQFCQAWRHRTRVTQRDPQAITDFGADRTSLAALTEQHRHSNPGFSGSPISHPCQSLWSLRSSAYSDDSGHGKSEVIQRPDCPRASTRCFVTAAWTLTVNNELVNGSPRERLL